MALRQIAEAAGGRVMRVAPKSSTPTIANIEPRAVHHAPRLSITSVAARASEPGNTCLPTAFAIVPPAVKSQWPWCRMRATRSRRSALGRGGGDDKFGRIDRGDGRKPTGRNTGAANGRSAEENGHPGGVTAMEQAARDHVWIHQLPWAEFESDNLRIFDRGEGARLYDVQGREYLDGIAGLWVVNAGHGRREIAQAYADQAARLGYASAMTIRLTRGKRPKPTTAPGASRVFFCSGGSEAVETALKIAKQVQVLRGFPKRYKIIARRRSYHGMTYGAMSLTATHNETWFGPFMYGVYHVPHPDRYRSDFGLEGEEADLMAARYVSRKRNRGQIRCGGMANDPTARVHLPSPQYWICCARLRPHGCCSSPTRSAWLRRTGPCSPLSSSGSCPT